MLLLAFAESSIQLVPDGTLILHVVVILVMVGVLNLTLFRPINRILQERDEETKGRLSKARQVLTSVGEKMSAYERSLKEARSKGYQLLERERATMLAEREQQLSNLKGEMKEWTVAQKAQIQSQTEDVRRGLDVEKSGAEIGSRILRRPV
jgi:F0F1-type ATP synthase membrane subunit b/b'